MTDASNITSLNDKRRELVRRRKAHEHYFGGCPECGDTDGYLNVGRCHWFVCDEHRTRWCAGANLFSCWKDESEAIWRTNSEKLDGFREVEPLSVDPNLDFGPEVA